MASWTPPTTAPPSSTLANRTNDGDGLGNACDPTPNGVPAVAPPAPATAPNRAGLRKKLKQAIAKGNKVRAMKLRAKLRKRGCRVR